MNTLLFISLFSALSVLYLVLGLRTSNAVATVHDYFLAGRNLGLLSVTFTLIATQLGGGMLLGTAAEAYTIGVYGILYTLGMSVGFLVLGCGLATKLQGLGIATTAQIFETMYGSKRLKQFASFLSIATLCGIFISQIIASKNLLLGIGIDYEWLFIAFWLFIIIYTILGGLSAVVITDIAQVLVIVIVFGGLFLYQLIYNPASFLATFTYTGAGMQFTSATVQKLLSTFFMPFCFALIEQDLAQRFFAAKNGRIAALAASAAGLFMLAFACIPIYFGALAKLTGIPLSPQANPLMPMIEAIAHPAIAALAVCGIIAAITSTADSLLCAISSNIAQDFTFNLGVKSQLKRSQLITCMVGIGALVLSYCMTPDIITILIESYALSVSGLFIPTIMALRTKEKGNPLAAWYACVAGSASFVIFLLFPVPFHQLVTLLISYIGYQIGQRQR